MSQSNIRIAVQVGASRVVWDESKGYGRKELKFAARAISAMMSGLKRHSQIGKKGWDIMKQDLGDILAQLPPYLVRDDQKFWLALGVIDINETWAARYERRDEEDLYCSLGETPRDAVSVLLGKMVRADEIKVAGV